MEDYPINTVMACLNSRPKPCCKPLKCEEGCHKPSTNSCTRPHPKTMWNWWKEYQNKDVFLLHIKYRFTLYCPVNPGGLQGFFAFFPPCPSCWNGSWGYWWKGWRKINNIYKPVWIYSSNYICSVETVCTFKYLGVHHLDNKIGQLIKMHSTEKARAGSLPHNARSFGVCKRLLLMFYQSVMASLPSYH